MRFRLLDKSGEQIHTGVIPRVKMPDAVIWSHRAFIAHVAEDETVTYREVDAFAIGTFRR